MGPGIDHLVVGATDLLRGCQAVEAFLGVRLSSGGKHRRMGTHNRLLNIGALKQRKCIECIE